MKKRGKARKDRFGPERPELLVTSLTTNSSGRLLRARLFAGSQLETHPPTHESEYRIESDANPELVQSVLRMYGARVGGESPPGGRTRAAESAASRALLVGRGS